MTDLSDRAERERLRALHNRIHFTAWEARGWPAKCGRCDEPWPCLVVRVIDSQGEELERLRAAARAVVDAMQIRWAESTRVAEGAPFDAEKAARHTIDAHDAIDALARVLKEGNDE